MKHNLDYHESKDFIKWIDEAPEKIRRLVEYEITWTSESRNAVLVTLFKKTDQLDVYDLWCAFKKLKA